MKSWIKTLLIVGLVLGGGAWLDYRYPVQEVKPVSVAKPVFNIKVYDLWVETNKLRSEPLELDAELNRTAERKCAYMKKRNEWAHGAWEQFVNPLNRGYYGENLAYGQYSSREIVKGWRNSPTHYENLVDPEFDSVGFGICQFRGVRLVVQHFSN